MTPLEIALVTIIAALLLILVAFVKGILLGWQAAEREWASERTRLLNAALHPNLTVPAAQTSNQQLEAEPDEDAAELNLVGQIIPITDGKKTENNS